MIITDRMKIYPISIEKLKEIVENEKNEILKLAYQEMLEGCIKNLENYIWYTLWFMELKDSDNEIVGSLSFKGISENGIVEIGYGINDGYENKGYTTEAVGEDAKNLVYDKSMLQDRNMEHHFGKQEKYERYLYLKERL